MLRPQSQAELSTQRQNNGQHTYNRAPHLMPDRIGDTLLHKHGLHPGEMTDEDGNPVGMHYANGRVDNNFFIDLFALIGSLLMFPVILAVGWYVGASLYFIFGVDVWLSLAAGVAMLIGAPWATRWVYFSGRNLKARGGLWHIPFGLVAIALAFAVPSYFGATWTWALIDYLQLAATEQARLYAGLGTGAFVGLAIYTALLSSR